MESSTTRAEEQRRKQDGILKQIAALQAQLEDTPRNTNLSPTPSALPPTSPKRKQPTSTLLVPPTPSPKKRKLTHRPDGKLSRSSGARNVKTPDSLRQGHSISPTGGGSETHPPKPSASNVLNRLVQLGAHPSEKLQTVQRSSGFSEKPPHHHDDQDGPFGENSVQKRDDRLALVEDLKLGPVDHAPPSDDPNFEKLEPNSGIRLSSRSVPHEDLQNHLYGRFYLSPSRLYSTVRLLPDKQGYDVPVEGDWITIAVVAERGPLKYSRAPVAIGPEGGEQAEEKKWKGKGKGKDDPPKPSGKKYVNLKLIDFGARSKPEGKAVIRGDAFLSLLLFESDGFDLVKDEGDRKARRIYKGGSRGAFEAMAKLKEGDVIALLNPRILKPFQRSNDNPHPTNNILAITPESASSIMNVGRARDLGMCSVMKKDDKICGSWYDKRVGDVCEYHVQHAVQQRRAARPEFSIGTMGMSASASSFKRKSAYDPSRRWGLAPADADSVGSTYIVSGHIVNGSKWDSRTVFDTESLGREGQAKAKRMGSGKDADRALMNLLKRDKEGMKAVMKARGVGKDGEGGEGDGDGRTGKSYSAQMIKRLGFDPVVKAGQEKGKADSDVEKKLSLLAAVQSSRKEITLGSRRMLDLDS